MIFSGYHYFLLNSSYLFLIRSYRFLTIFSFFFSLHRFSLFHRNQCSYYWSWSSLVPRLFVVLTRFTGFFFAWFHQLTAGYEVENHTHTLEDPFRHHGRRSLSPDGLRLGFLIRQADLMKIRAPIAAILDDTLSAGGKKTNKRSRMVKKKSIDTQKKRKKDTDDTSLFFLGGGGVEILIAIIFEEKRSVGVRRRRSLFGRQDPFFLDRKP